MLDCCEGHSVEILVRLGKDNANYISLLNIDEALDIINMLDGGECPVCSGLIPLRQGIAQ